MASTFDWSMSSAQQDFDLNSDGTTIQAIDDFSLPGASSFESSAGIRPLMSVRISRRRKRHC
jgi:hypothetical protein